MEKGNSSLDYQEIEKMIPSQVRDVRAILKDKYGISIPSHCDEFIVRCLRLKDGNKEKAIKLMKTFHATTIDFNDWDATLTPSLYENYYNKGTVVPMLQRDSQGRRVFLIQTAKWNPQEMNFDEAIAGLWIMAQYLNAEYIDVQRNGIVTVWDFSNFNLQQAWAVKQWRVITLGKWISNSVAGRIKGFHAINHPRIVGVLYAGVKPFLKEKLRKRVYFHDSVESLQKFVGPECLPESVGGHLEENEGIDKPMINDLILKDEFFKDMMKHGFPAK